MAGFTRGTRGAPRNVTGNENQLRSGVGHGGNFEVRAGDRLAAAIQADFQTWKPHFLCFENFEGDFTR